MSALEEARATTNRVARTFALACRMLPRDVRDDVYLLYLVFRTLDDLVDEGRPEAAARVGAVSRWAAGALGARTPEVEVLIDLARRHDLPRDALLDFCLGMGEDLEGAEYETEADVDRYCYRVAGTVGVVMASLLGTERPERARPAAAALGMAMQRTNILRDIDEDAANGRVYIARDAGALRRQPAPGRARISASRPDRPRRRALRAGHRRDRRAAARTPRDRSRGRHVSRTAAQARAGGLRRARGPRRGAALPQAGDRGAGGMARVMLAVLAVAQVLYGRSRRTPPATRGLVGLMLATSVAGAGRRGARSLALAGAIGFAAELVGVATGRPFGHYAYSDKLGPRVRGVPLLAAAAWAMMARPAWAVAGRLTRGPARVPLAATALTAWDVYLDPRMVREGYWSWPGGGRYEGVPASNFAGWFVTGLGVFAVFAGLEHAEDDGDAVALYVWTGLGEGIANAVVWRRPVVAAAGGLAMGAFAVPALLRR